MPAFTGLQNLFVNQNVQIIPGGLVADIEPGLNGGLYLIDTQAVGLSKRSKHLPVRNLPVSYYPN